MVGRANGMGWDGDQPAGPGVFSVWDVGGGPYREASVRRTVEEAEAIIQSIRIPREYIKQRETEEGEEREI